MRVALVHYWLVKMRGGEKVLEVFVPPVSAGGYLRKCSRYR